MYYLLFIFYLSVLSYFIPRIPFMKHSGLGTKMITGLFLLKVLAGCLIGWMSQKFYPQGNDYWGLNDAGKLEYEVLVNHPRQFFSEIFYSSYHHYGGFFDSANSFWNDLKNTLVGKLLAFCNLFSRGNYYINALIFNFFGFFGHMALYRVFARLYPNREWQVITGCFLLPSALYFSAGIHKDLLVFTALGLFFYNLYAYLESGRKRIYIFMIAVSWLLLLFVRNFVAVALLPAAIAWIIASYKKWKPLPVYTGIYLLFFCISLFVQLLFPSFRPLEVVARKQQAFLELPFASTQIDTNLLQPSWYSFIKNAPTALNHSVLRPYLGEWPTGFLIPLSVELYIYWGLFIIMLIFYRRQAPGNLPALYFCLFVSFSMLLLIGYIVPNIGSIVRYRSLYLPFLLTPVLCSIRFKQRT